ncbi:Ff.00g011400.m01.CDS01 [Fusarium sp. VM40]|nr:Ff.00g011400.m01.CDS01 [Fusarium sp. VM40]
MTTGTNTEVNQTSILERYLFCEGQSSAQGRLASGRPAPTVEEKTAEMSRHLAGLGQGTIAVHPKEQMNKMAQELDSLLEGK